MSACCAPSKTHELKVELDFFIDESEAVFLKRRNMCLFTQSDDLGRERFRDDHGRFRHCILDFVLKFPALAR
jgi:hypothetical protein